MKIASANEVRSVKCEMRVAHRAARPSNALFLTSHFDTRVGDWLPLMILPAMTLVARNCVPDWVFMWLLCGAFFLGCKWLTLRPVMREKSPVGQLVSFGYVFGWIGMDAIAFFGKRDCPAPRRHEWVFATARVFLGVILIGLATKLSLPALASGWLFLAGLIFCLHFGSLQLLTLAWRRAGFRAEPLMREPARSVSVAEFWGRRWNRAFHRLVHDFAFKPLARRWGAPGAMLMVFVISGLIHDLVISLPARGGYGLPTAYFLIQAAGLMLERSRAGRALGLGEGWRGWLFTMKIVAGPVFWLFHPPFVHGVILPMLNAIGAR